MKELVFVGRGGQGVVLASQLLADAFARAGYWTQSFPEFKAERRGAPISAFMRWDDAAPIHRRYKVRDCDVLVDISTTPPTAELIRTVRPGGLIVLNRESRFRYRGPFEVARVPGAQIARRNGVFSSEGRPMGNVAVLGACVRLLIPGGLEFLEQAIAARMGALAESNIASAREGYERCTRQHAIAGDSPVGPAPAAGARRKRHRPLFPVSTTDSRLNETGSWSLDRPVFTKYCTACGVCVLFCPEGVITRNGNSMDVEYLYCKGCGICEVVCPVRDAIELEEVRE